MEASASSSDSNSSNPNSSNPNSSNPNSSNSSSNSESEDAPIIHPGQVDPSAPLPEQATDEDGNPLPKELPIDVGPNAMPPALDNEGKVITDDYNNPLDVTGQPVFALDETHKPVLDEQGVPVPATMVDTPSVAPEVTMSPQTEAKLKKIKKKFKSLKDLSPEESAKIKKFIVEMSNDLLSQGVSIEETKIQVRESVNKMLTKGIDKVINDETITADDSNEDDDSDSDSESDSDSYSTPPALITIDPDILPEAYRDRNTPTEADNEDNVQTQSIDSPAVPPPQRRPITEDDGTLDNIDNGSLVSSAFYAVKNFRIWYIDQGDQEIKELGTKDTNRIEM